MEKMKDDRYKVVTTLTKTEKELLRLLAWDSGRSVAGYLRFLVNEAIDLMPD